jgi:hypothetical protein
MSTQSINYTEDSSSAAVSTAAVQDSGQSQSQEVTLGLLMKLIGETQKGMSELQALYAASQGTKKVDATTGTTTFVTFAQIQGDALIDSTKKSCEKYLNALAEQAKQNKHNKILKAFITSLMIVVAVAATVISGGAAGPLLMLAITIVCAAMSSSGKGDPFQMATKALAGELVKAGMSEKAANLVSAILVTAVMAYVAGGASGASSIAAGVTDGITIGKGMLFSGMEMTAQMSMETGAIPDAMDCIADATGWDKNSKGFKAAEGLMIGLTLIMGMAGGAGMAKVANNGSTFSKLLNELVENPDKVRKVITGIQNVSMGTEAAFSIGSGSCTIKAAKEGYDAEMAQKDITGNNAELEIVNFNGSSSQDTINALIADLDAQLSSISRNIDKGFATKI